MPTARERSQPITPQRPNGFLQRLLPNGLTVLLQEDRKAPVAISHVWFRVGSNYEWPKVHGWAHGIEHMIFKGTRRRGPGDVSREVKRAGGELNASTGHETTSYYIMLPSRNLDVAIDIHADALRHALFDPGELDREREVLVEENRMRMDQHTGGGHTWEELMELVFTRAPYRRAIGGPSENLRRASRADILAFRDAYYVPANCAVVLAGDFDARDVLRRVVGAYGGWRGANPPRRRPLREPAQRAFRYRTSTGDVEQAYLKLGYRSAGDLDPETFAVRVLAQLLAGGRGSRLYQEVRERRGLVQSVTMLEESGPDLGCWVVDVVTDTPRLAEAEAAIVEEIERLKHGRLPVEEVERAKIAIERDYELANESVRGQSSHRGWFWAMREPAVADTYLDRIRAVTPEAVQEAARRRFGLEQCSVNVFHPREDESRVESRPAAVHARLAKRAAAARRESPARREAGTATRRPAAARREMLPRGLTLLTRTIAGAPVVALGAFVRCGTYYETPEKNGITALMQRVMLKGTARLGAREIAERMEALGGSLSPFYGADAAGCFVTVLRRHLAQAWDLLGEVLTAPSFPAEEVERERKVVLSEIAAREDHSVMNTLVEFQRAVFGAHPYALPTLGTRESVSALTREELVDWYRRFYPAPNLVLAAVGDFDGERLAARASELDGLPGGGPAEFEAGPVAGPGARVEKVLARDVAQEVIVAGFPGPGGASADRYPMVVLEHVLSGMGNRLFVELRDKRSLCYFTGLLYRPYRRGGLLGAYVGTSPDKEELALESLLGELRQAVERPVTREELRRARNTIVGNFALDQQSTSALAALYAGSEIAGLGHDWAERYPERILAVGSEEVQRVARQYLDLERMAVVMTKPAAPAGAALGGDPGTGGG